FAISGPILVKLTKNFSPKLVLMISMILFIIGNGIIAFSPNVTILVIVRVLSSAAAAIIVVKILDITVIYTKPSQRGKMIGLVYTEISASNDLGVTVGTTIGEDAGGSVTFLYVCLIIDVEFIRIYMTMCI